MIGREQKWPPCQDADVIPLRSLANLLTHRTKTVKMAGA